MIMLCLLSGHRALAQDDDLPPTDEPPVPAAPIDYYVPALFVIGAVYAARIVKNRKANSSRAQDKQFKEP